MPIFAKFFAQFLQKNSTNSLLKLQSYWTDLHHVFTRCSDIRATFINACIYKTILYFVSERQSMSEGSQFRRLQKRPKNKLQLVTIAKSYCDIYVSFVIAMHVAIPVLKCSWSSIQHLLRYLVRYVDFCHLIQKNTETPCVIFGVSEQIAIKLA